MKGEEDYLKTDEIDPETNNNKNNNINDDSENDNDNDVVNPTGLINYLYEKKEQSNSGYNYKYYEMETGNICYMNSSIQCLFHLKDFTTNILRESKNNDGALITATSELIKGMQRNYGKKSGLLSAKNIKRAMVDIDQRYRDNNQGDANEFISNFLDGLLDEIGDKKKLPERININESDIEAYDKFYNRFYKIKGNSFLLDLFYSILKIQKICKKCKEVVSTKFNAYNLFELPIYDLAEKRNDIAFKDILDNYFKKNQNIILFFSSFASII